MSANNCSGTSTEPFFVIKRVPSTASKPVHKHARKAKPFTVAYSLLACIGNADMVAGLHTGVSCVVGLKTAV